MQAAAIAIHESAGRVCDELAERRDPVLQRQRADDSFSRSVYSFLVARAGDFLRRSGIRRALDGLTGAVLIGLGARLAFERR
jgi:hypothetical protein